MNKILHVLSAVIAFAVVALPLQASALDRIAATFTNGDAYLKEGAVGAGWHQLTSGVDIGNFSLAGDRVSLLDDGNGQKPISIKEPLWNSSWDYTYYSDGSLPKATKTLVSQLSNGQYRLLVLRDDGSVVMKDGPWNTGWWSGTIADSGVDDIVIGGDRIGIIKGGEFKVKQLTPGQFSHPNNTDWNLEASDVDSAAMNNNWIAYRDGSKKVYAKEGTTTAPWFSNKAVIYDNVSKVRLGGNRLCVVKLDEKVECKEGSLGANSVQTYSGASDVKVSATRFVVVKSDKTLLVNEGSLTNNSGWQTVGTNVTAVEIN